MDQDPRVYLLADGERQLVPGGPAVVGPDGSRHEVPIRVYEAFREVEGLLRSGKAVQLRPLEPELSIFEAAEVITMDPDELRSYVEDGEIPSRTTGVVTWVRLADVLDFDRRLQAQRDQAMRDLAGEERWDGDTAGAGSNG